MSGSGATVTLRRYGPAQKSDWSRVLAAARNGVFLFERDFLEYHGERFQDFSYLGYLNGRPVALFPAALAPDDDHVISHPGLTFGGVVFRKDLRSSDAMVIVDALLDALKAQGIARVTIRLLPEFFCTYPSQDAHYALWRRGFTVVQRGLSSVIPLKDRLPFNRSKQMAVKKAKQSAVILTEPLMAALFKLLKDVLHQRHNVEPIHTLEELELLQSRFPDKILARGAALDGALIAGALIFRYRKVWHTQYLAASDAARDLGALDLVIDDLIREADEQGAEGLSFGISTIDGGTKINHGLLWQKESYGARPIVHDHLSCRL